MPIKLWPFFMLIAGGLFGACSWTGAANDDSLSVEELIAQLGDEQYVLRQRAETQLLERGAEVFAELQAAERDADLEIATRAKYILNQISIDWVRPTDPAVVRSMMAAYGELPLLARLARITKLSKLEHEQGFGALCRIARFDSAAKVVRSAALAILEQGFLPTARTESAVTRLRKELGDGEQAPLSWIDVYAAQLESRETIDSRWLTLIDAEISLLLEDRVVTSELRVLKLLRCHLDLSEELGDANAIVASLQRRIEMFAQRDEETELDWGSALSWAIGYYQWKQLEQRDNRDLLGLVDASIWLIEQEQWQAFELLEDRYEVAMDSQPWLIYLVAIARSQQGRLQEAEQLAASALRLDRDDAEECNRRTDLIAELGRHDWAEREWNLLVETLPATDYQSLSARQSLGNYCLHDRREYQAAADLLAETIDAIHGDPAMKRRYQSNSGLVKDFRTFQSLQKYFLACQFQSQGDFGKQRIHLEEAYKLDPSEVKNVDLLIAMYRLPDSTESYRKVVERRIAKAQGQIEKQIKQSLVNLQRYRQESNLTNSLAVRLAAQSLNQWAWLISNTEGDSAKAVQFSEESLELQPGNPSYLDTLGRCYYATGDLEKALKVQRAAIAKHSHLEVMQRQLTLFENELQERQSVE